MTMEIFNCPFCESSRVYVESTKFALCDKSFVICRDCSAVGPSSIGPGETRGLRQALEWKAAEKWNRTADKLKGNKMTQEKLNKIIYALASVIGGTADKDELEIAYIAVDTIKILRNQTEELQAKIFRLETSIAQLRDELKQGQTDYSGQGCFDPITDL